MNVGWLLLKKSGRRGTLKLVITAIAAALGTLMLLAVFSVSHAVNRSFDRQSWRDVVTSPMSSTKQLSPEDISQPNAVLIYTSNFDTFLGKTITEYSTYFTGGTIPSGSPLASYPKEGEYYVSPALNALINKYPDSALKDRFEGVQAGTVPDSALASPEELVIIYGLSKAALEDPANPAATNAIRITDFSASAQSDLAQLNKIILTAMMGAGAIGLIIPILMLITTATTLGAREREERYAALRLIGATRSQLRRITMIDSLLASTIGIVSGITLYFLLRPAIAKISLIGMPSFPEDVIVAPLTVALIIVGIFMIVWLANRSAMRKIITSPLGVARKQTLRKSPRIWSVLPLVACVAGFGYFASLDKTKAYEQFGDSYAFYLLALFLVTMLSILLAGSWLMTIYGKILGGLNRKASGLLVSRRIRHEARAIFRGIGAVVVAFYAGSFFIVSFATVSALSSSSQPTIMKVTPNGAISITSSGQGDDTHIKQVTQQAVAGIGSYQHEPITQYIAENAIYVSCNDVQRLNGQTCQDMSKYVMTTYNSYAPTFDMSKTTDGSEFLNNDLTFTVEVYIPENSQTSTDIKAEEAVTVIKRADPNAYVTILSDTVRNATVDSVMNSIRQLLYAGIILTVIVAGLNLTIATVSGLLDRKGSFFTLRLGGAGLPFLKRVVVKESMLPLIFISLVSIGLGFYTAYVFLRLSSGLLEDMFSLPDPFFWVCVGAVFILSYAGIRLALPMLNNLTRIDENRSE